MQLRKENPEIAKAGTLIFIDQGRWSDYEVIGFFVALQDFEPMEELSRYLESHPDQKNAITFAGQRFLAICLLKDF